MSRLPWNDRSRGFLNLVRFHRGGMRSQSGRFVSVALSILLLTAFVLPSITIAVSSGPSRVQLQSLIVAAEGSRSYARASVQVANPYGIDVTGAASVLAEGDSFLSSAQD